MASGAPDPDIASPPSPPRRRRPRRGAAPRPPPPPPAATTAPPGADVFVTARTDFRAQLRRCQRLLGTGGGVGGVGGSGPPGSPPAPPAELRLHGLGLAVPRAINLALQLQAGGGLRLHACTSSVALPPPGAPRRRRAAPRREEGDEDEDDEDEEEEGSPRPRHNSAIHIRVWREAPCA